MINSDMTLFKKKFNKKTHLDEWKRFYYPEVLWQFKSGATLNQGISRKSNLTVRLTTENNIFAVGDVLVKGDMREINTLEDLQEYFTIVEVTDNNFSGIPHIHVVGI